MLVDKKDLITGIKNEEMELAKEICITNQVPTAFKNRLLQQIQFRQEKGFLLDPAKVMSHMPLTNVYKLVEGSVKGKKFLSSYDLFANCRSYSSKSLMTFLVNAKPFYWDDKEVIYSRNDLALDVYFLNLGSLLNVVRDEHKGKDVVFSEISSQAVFGLEGLYKLPRETTVVACTYGWGVFIRTVTFNDILSTDRSLKAATHRYWESYKKEKAIFMNASTASTIMTEELNKETGMIMIICHMYHNCISYAKLTLLFLLPDNVNSQDTG